MAAYLIYSRRESTDQDKSLRYAISFKLRLPVSTVLKGVSESKNRRSCMRPGIQSNRL